MRVERADHNTAKGWYLGPWNSDLDISIGYANDGVDEPHLHERMTEIYCIARGTVEIRIERETISLGAGEVIVVEPGQAHTFLSSSRGYLHFVIQVPGLEGKEAQRDKILVPRSRLGL